MGYEDAAATKIMATHCCACGKPLVDAKSVEVGMGPTCRKKYGWGMDVPEAVRALANKMIYRLACDVSQDTVTMESMDVADRLRDLGFDKIADIFQGRLIKIAVTVDTFDGVECYLVRAPYDETGKFNYDCWAKGRFGIKVPAFKAATKKKVFHWAIPKNSYSRKRIFDALVKHHEGSLAFAPDGSVFQIAPLKTAAQKAAEAAEKAA
jgi:hypothetical protein